MIAKIYFIIHIKNRLHLNGIFVLLWINLCVSLHISRLTVLLILLLLLFQIKDKNTNRVVGIKIELTKHLIETIGEHQQHNEHYTEWIVE